MGRLGTLRRPESQEACPGTSTQLFDGKSPEAPGLPGPFEDWEGFFFSAYLPGSSAAPRRENGEEEHCEEGRRQKAEIRSQKSEVRSQESARFDRPEFPSENRNADGRHRPSDTLHVPFRF